MRGLPLRLILAATLILAGAPVSLAAPAPASALVRVELLSETRSIVAGRTFWVALRQEITPGWHTYWKNPGDSGEPPRLEWALPAGFTAGEIAVAPARADRRGAGDELRLLARGGAADRRDGAAAG